MSDYVQFALGGQGPACLIQLVYCCTALAHAGSVCVSVCVCLLMRFLFSTAQHSSTAQRSTLRAGTQFACCCRVCRWAQAAVKEVAEAVRRAEAAEAEAEQAEGRAQAAAAEVSVAQV